jgi:glutamyl-tRNA synthetase
MIRGKMIVPSDSLTDPVLLKSDGIPMYNLAVVYDDYIMEITHITRAEEHLSNTPYQIAIREAIEPILLEQGFSKNNEPFYAHLPIVIGSDGKKLSKRNKTLLQFVCGEKGQDYISLGYFPDAIRNFVVLLG